jgi:WD40 repeat protein
LDLTAVASVPDAIKVSNAERVGQSARWTAGGTIGALAWSADSRTIAIASSGRADIVLWDVATRQARATIESGSSTINGLAFSPDGLLLAHYSTTAPLVAVWDVRTGKRKFNLGGAFGFVAFSADGANIASLYKDGDKTQIGLWNPQTGRLSRVLRTEQSECRTTPLPVFSPDGKLMTCSLIENRIQIWDVASGNLRTSIQGANSGYALAFSLDSTLLATGGMDTVEIWSVETAQRVRILITDKKHNTAVAIGGDGGVLATAGNSSNDTTSPITLWDVKTGEVKMSLWGHTAFITHLQFSPDGRLLSSADSSGVMRLWSVR